MKYDDEILFSSLACLKYRSYLIQVEVQFTDANSMDNVDTGLTNRRDQIFSDLFLSSYTE